MYKIVWLFYKIFYFFNDVKFYDVLTLSIFGQLK